MDNHLDRSHKRNAAQSAAPTPEERRRRQIRSWIILVSVVVAVLLGIRFLSGAGNGREISASRLPCYSGQDVTPFGNYVLYYDGASIHCLTSTGTIRWSFPVGTGANFSIGPTHIVIWSGRQIYLIDQNGNPTYNEAQEDVVQFARVGERYAAVIIGPDTEPKLIVKDLAGVQVDVESEAFQSLMVLDVGFYGDQGQYLWTLSLDMYGTAANTILNTFQVGKMNTGEISLGSFLTYKVLFEDSKLRVFTTQQMYTYDYKCVQDTNATMLVYGWKVIDTEVPARGSAKILMAPTSQTSSSQTITELRVLEGGTDKRYTLPDACCGAAILDGNVYAFSSGYMYRGDVSSQRFYGYPVPLPDGMSVTAYLGVTSDGHALLASGDTVYSVTMPRK